MRAQLRRAAAAALIGCSVACTAQPSTPAAAPATRPGTPLSAEQWRADLAFLVRTLPARHPKPFTKVTREQWLAAASRLDAQIPSLARDEIAVGFAKLVALLGDAHTIAYASDMPPGFHPLPIRLFWFADGLHVVAATRGNESLLGRPLASVGDLPVNDAVAAVTPTFVAENEALRKTGAAQALTSAEILHAVGLSRDTSQATFGFAGPAGTPPIQLTPLADGRNAQWVRWPDAA